MKSLQRYLDKREAAIETILEKPRKEYNTETFHILRLEIKKLNAFFDLIKFCVPEFKKKKTFTPFKEIFRQAGKVRELQLEQIQLKNYLYKYQLREYRKSLKKQQLIKEATFFSNIDKMKLTQLKNKYHEILPFLKEIKKEYLKDYMEEMKTEIRKTLLQKPLQPEEIHTLRKQLKKYNYNRKIFERNKPVEPDPQIIDFTELLGKWGDNVDINRHLKKAIDSGNLNEDELKELEDILAKINSESKQLLDKINKSNLYNHLNKDVLPD